MHGYFPDYALEFGRRDIVISRRREPVVDGAPVGRMEPETCRDARRVSPGWDVYMLEAEWWRWCAAEEIEPKAPARHFVKFCGSWAERRGRP